MSRDYFISEDYGLMITESMLNNQCKNFAKQYKNKLSIADEAIADENFYVSDFSDSLWTIFDINNFESFQVQTLKDKHFKNINESFIIIPCDSTLFFFDTTYKKFEDIINEFKIKFSKHLPDNFDYENNLVIAKGIYYG